MQDFSLGLDRRDEVKAVIGERAEFTAYCNCVMVRTLTTLRRDPAALSLSVMTSGGKESQAGGNVSVVAASQLEAALMAQSDGSLPPRAQDRETLDATLSAPSGGHEIRSRSELGGERIPLTDQQFMDLITVHVADFIEQVRPVIVAPSAPPCHAAAFQWPPVMEPLKPDDLRPAYRPHADRN